MMTFKSNQIKIIKYMFYNFLQVHTFDIYVNTNKISDTTGVFNNNVLPE